METDLLFSCSSFMLMGEKILKQDKGYSLLFAFKIVTFAKCFSR